MRKTKRALSGLVIGVIIALIVAGLFFGAIKLKNRNNKMSDNGDGVNDNLIADDYHINGEEIIFCVKKFPIEFYFEVSQAPGIVTAHWWRETQAHIYHKIGEDLVVFDKTIGKGIKYDLEDDGDCVVNKDYRFPDWPSFIPKRVMFGQGDTMFTDDATMDEVGLDKNYPNWYMGAYGRGYSEIILPDSASPQYERRFQIKKELYGMECYVDEEPFCIQKDKCIALVEDSPFNYDLLLEEVSDEDFIIPIQCK